MPMYRSKDCMPRILATPDLVNQEVYTPCLVETVYSLTLTSAIPQRPLTAPTQSTREHSHETPKE